LETWQPHPGPQTKFHKSSAYEVFYGGALGGGKSDSLLMEALRQIDKPRYRALLMRRTFPELEMSLIRRSHEVYPAVGGDYNATKHTWTFPSGAIVQFGHCANDEDVYRFQSSEFAYIGFDEASHFTPFQYQYMLTRNRTPDKSIKKYIRAASNPGNVGHDFFKKRFIDGKEPFKVYTDPDTQTTRQFIPAKLKDNLTMMKNDPDYINRLQNMPANKKKALLDGNWDIFEGQFFEDWHTEVHLVDPFDIPSGWTRFRAIDYGRTAPLCCLWFAVDFDKNLYLYKEYYHPEPDTQMLPRTAEEHAKAIMEMSDGLEKYTVIGKDAFNKSAGVESPADIMRRVGLVCTPANSDRIVGWSVVKEFMHWQKDNKGQYIIEPKVKFFTNCYNLIRTLPNQIYATDVGMGQEFSGKFKEDLDPRGEDHAVDAFRFGVMSRQYPSTKDKGWKHKKQQVMTEDFKYSTTTYN